MTIVNNKMSFSKVFYGGLEVTAAAEPGTEHITVRWLRCHRCSEMLVPLLLF